MGSVLLLLLLLLLCVGSSGVGVWSRSGLVERAARPAPEEDDDRDQGGRFDGVVRQRVDVAVDEQPSRRRSQSRHGYARLFRVVRGLPLESRSSERAVRRKYW